MFSPSITTHSSFSGPSYISDRTARQTAQNAYDSELAQSASTRRPQMGKGMGAGSARTDFNRSNRREAGMAGARSAYSNAYMDAVEANRMGRMQYETDQAREGAALSGLMQDLAQANFLDRFSAASTQQAINRTNDARNRNIVSTQLSLLQSLFS